MDFDERLFSFGQSSAVRQECGVSYCPLTQKEGWWFRCLIQREDFLQVWDDIQGFCSEMRLGFSFDDRRDSLSCFALCVEWSAPTESWSDILGALDRIFCQHNFDRMVCPLGDRPVHRSAYWSVRYGDGLGYDVDRALEYNEEGHKSLIWDVVGDSDVFAPCDVMLPRVWEGEWVYDSSSRFWSVEGDLDDMLALRKAREHYARRGYVRPMMTGASFSIEETDTVSEWWLWGELADVYRLSFRLEAWLMSEIRVVPRQDDGTPPEIWVPRTDQSESRLSLLLGNEGFSVLCHARHLSFSLPSRSVTRRLLAFFLDEEGAPRLPTVARKTVGDVRPPQARSPLRSLRPPSRAEMALAARAAAAQKHVLSRRPGGLARALKKANAVSLTKLSKAERLVSPLTKEVGTPFAEDTRDVVKDMIGFLQDVVGIEGSDFSSQDRMQMKDTIRLLSRAHGDRTVSRHTKAFQAMKQSENLVRSVSKHCQTSQDVRLRSLGNKGVALTGRSEVRRSEGPPKVKVQMSEAERLRLEGIKKTSFSRGRSLEF